MADDKKTVKSKGPAKNSTKSKDKEPTARGMKPATLLRNVREFMDEEGIEMSAPMSDLVSALERDVLRDATGIDSY